VQIEVPNAQNHPNPRQADTFKALLGLFILLEGEQKLETLFEIIVRETNLLLKADHTTLFLLDYEKKELYSVFGLGLTNREIRLPLGRGIAGIVAFTGQSLYSNDTQNDPRHLGDQFGYLTRNMLTVPLRANNNPQVLGVLQVLNKEAGDFDNHDHAILEMLASLAAMAITRAIRAAEQQKLTAQLGLQARHDALTGLPNRLFLEENLQQILVEAGLKQHQVAVLFIDLDRFKLINNSLGHAIGDTLLQQVAHRLQNQLRYADMVTRVGGDEFVVVLKVVRNVQNVNNFAQKLLKALQEPFYVEGQELYISASIGISLYPTHGETVSEILRYADNAMYRVKDAGKNNYQFFQQDMSETAQRNLLLVTQLHKALEYGELVLHYQPKINLPTGKLAGVEALIRWKHRELGLISPGEFIPLAEETGLIVPVGALVMEESCRQAKTWQTQGYKPFRIGVNVSAIQFNRDDFIELVEQCLEKSQLEARWLELELTEGLLLSNTQNTINKLNQLKELGVSLAIDDFGTGYSSLRYLQQLPIDVLKIDQSFVSGLDASSEKAAAKAKALVKTIAMLGQNLEMAIIAEGVETEKQLSYLREIGCEEVQGYLYSRPLGLTDFETFMQKHL